MSILLDTSFFNFEVSQNQKVFSTYFEKGVANE